VIDVAVGSEHAGWTVTGPSPEGARRWPVEREGKTGTLALFPFHGTQGEANRAHAERVAAWRDVSHELLEHVDTERAGDDGLFVVQPGLERLQEGPLGPDDALTAVDRVAGALRAFHDRGLAHGEVEPWSIVRRPDGPALLPPGLRGPPAGVEALGLKTDPRWAAPEVLDGQAPTPASDVFQLGLLLFRLSTGQPPVAAAEPVEAFVARAAAPVPDLQAVKPDLPPQLKALYQCLVADLDVRPKDAAEAQALLNQVAKKKAPSLPERKVARIAPIKIGAPVVALLLLLGACAILWEAVSGRFAPTSPVEGYQLEPPR
jgi:hypothetical protein